MVRQEQKRKEDLKKKIASNPRRD